jgi:hypothetical protein
MGASLLVPQLLQIAQGIGAGASSGATQAQALSQQYAMTKRGQALQDANNANALERQTQTNPLRDQTLYNLAGMLGASPAAFNPTSMLSGTNSGPQGVGGVNQNAVANYNAAYTPGAGGVTSNVQQMILNRLGYGNVPTGTLFDNPTTPADTLTGAPTPGVTSGASNKGGFGVVPDPYSASQNTGYTNSNPEQTGAPGSTGPGTSAGSPGPIGGPGSAGMLNATPFKLAALGGIGGGAPAVASAAGGMGGSAPMPAATAGAPAAAPTDAAGQLAAQQKAALMARLTGGTLAAT